MKSVVSLLEDIEKLAYKILLWLILIPKTIVQITINPDWAPKYIEGELRSEEKTLFAEFISPVILLLYVAFIPAISVNFLPVFGTTISSPAEKEATTDPFLTFYSETNFISGSKNLKYTADWYIEKITDIDKSGNNIYSEIPGSRENHKGNDEDYVKYINNNIIQDKFTHFFDPGDYYVNISVEKIDPQKDNRPIETYSSYLWVSVPPSQNDQISISNSAKKSDQGKTSFEDFTDRLKKESSFFLALGLLIPPLLFAVATKIFITDITETTLRESFYAQCYYFSIIALAFWVTYFSQYFFTPDIFGYKTHRTSLLIIYLPLILAAIWFVFIETRAIALERLTTFERLTKDSQERVTKFSIKDGRKAFLIVVICILVLGALFNIAISFSAIIDSLRVIVIRLYPVIAGLLLLGFFIARIKRKGTEN